MKNELRLGAIMLSRIASFQPMLALNLFCGDIIA